MTVVDAWRAYRHHMHHNHCHKDISLIRFLSILTKDLLRHRLTRRIEEPPHCI